MRKGLSPSKMRTMLDPKTLPLLFLLVSTRRQMQRFFALLRMTGWVIRGFRMTSKQPTLDRLGSYNNL